MASEDLKEPSESDSVDGAATMLLELELEDRSVSLVSGNGKGKRRSRSRTTHQRSPSGSSSCTKNPAGDKQLPRVLFIDFDSEGKLSCQDPKVFQNKHEAARDVKSALESLLQSSPCIGHFRKVTLHTDKRSVYVWFEGATEASINSTWLLFFVL